MAMETTLSSNIPSQEWRERHQCLLESHGICHSHLGHACCTCDAIRRESPHIMFLFHFDFAPRALYQRNANDMAKLHGEDCDFPPVKL